jgi:hypothetical protein
MLGREGLADAAAQDEGGEENQEKVFHISPLMLVVGGCV